MGDPPDSISVDDQRGSILTEAVIGTTILAVLVLGLTAALPSGLRYLLTAKQRTAAVHAASAILERARAVAASDWTQLGLVASDLPGDPGIASGACGSSPSVPMFSGEPIVQAGTVATNPLNPHVRTVAVGASAVQLKIYVTGVSRSGCSATNPEYKRVTVLGSWDREQSGVSNEVKLVTYVFDSVRPPQIEFEGSAAYGSGRVISAFADLADTAETTVHFPQSAGDVRTVGRIQVAKGTGTSALADVDGVLSFPEHSAASIADDDGLTAVGPGTWPSPNCTSGSWTDYVGGLLDGNAAGSAESCSSVRYDDTLPHTHGTAVLTGTDPVVSNIPATGPLPAFPVTNFAALGVMSTQSIVDRLRSGTNERLLARSSFSSGGIDLMRFAALGFNAADGAVSVGSGDWEAEVRVGQGTAGDPVPLPSLSGSVTYKVFDPAAIIAGCSSRSGDYCVFVVDPTSGTFSGLDETYVVPLTDAGNRITLTTRVVIPDPIVSHTLSGTNMTAASATYALPKITCTMLVEAPIGTTIATLTDDADLGQIVVSGAFRSA